MQAPDPNPLAEYFRLNPGREIMKWHHYFEIYDRYFGRFRGTKVRVLEIGVSHGGSLQMWKQYFGAESEIVGVDIDQRCKQLEEPGIRVEIGNQSDRGFWRRFKAAYPSIDIVIDDGGHRPEQQIASFDELFWHLSPDGIYLCEDLHTNYWRSYGGGLLQQQTFVEYAKRLVDHLTFWHSEDHRLQTATEFTKSTWGVHFYDSVAVFEKRRRTPPKQTVTGKKSF